ncbi:MAG: PQQ-binding-like beta-propeller repeat protein, partial [Proteobacteria bacterium]|nr:PQQ-binding-like beta-propeller repeat protein [Pseudomonadota bacterium]
MLKSIFYILLPLSFLSCKTLPQSALVDSSIEVKRLSGHKSEIGFAKLLPGSGRSLVTGGLNGQVFVWDLEAGRKSWGLTFTGSVYDALPSPGGESVFIAASKGLIQRLDARTGASLKKWLHPERGAAIKLAMTSDGRTLAVAYLNGELVYMDTQTGAESKPFKGVFDWPVVRAMDFSKDGRRLFIADPGSATEVDVLTGTILRRVRDLRYCQASKCIPWLTAAAISSDRRLVAVGSLNAVRVYNMENGLEVFTLGEHIGEVSHLEFRNGHQQLISQSLDGGSMAWGIPSGKLMIMHNNERPNIWNTGLDEMSTHLIGFDRDNFDIVLSRVKNIAATYSSTNDKDLFGQATI